MGPTLCQIAADFLQQLAVKDFNDAVLIEVTQHIWVASTAGFYITTGIDMQTTPRGRAKEICHPVFTGGLLAPGRFGFAEVLTGKPISDQALA